MDLIRFHNIMNQIKQRNIYLIDDLDIKKEIDRLFSEENFIQSCDVRVPYIIIKTKVPKDFLMGFLQIDDDTISCNFSNLEYSSYLIDCDKFKKQEAETSKCDIIDIAEEEMKNIDSSEIDSEFDKVMIEEYTTRILDLIDTQSCKQEDLDEYRRILNDDTIEDLRVSERMLYIKTHPVNTKATLSEIMGLEERCFEKIPIHSRYAFYVVDAKRWSSPKTCKPSYNADDLIEALKTTGKKCEEEDVEVALSFIKGYIKQAFEERWVNIPDNMPIEYGIEDQVLAIAFPQFIEEAKEFIGAVLEINPELFIEVSSPWTTVLLIDTRRWYLEDEIRPIKWGF